LKNKNHKMKRDTTRIVGLCINFRVVRPRKSRVYLTESSSPMSDSHVNDIRYTALWRPVVKAKVAPAESPSSLTSLVWSVRFFPFLRDFISGEAEPRFPFPSSRTHFDLLQMHAILGWVQTGMRTTANSIYPDGESVRFCREGRPQQLRPALPLRA